MEWVFSHVGEYKKYQQLWPVWTSNNCSLLWLTVYLEQFKLSWCNKSSSTGAQTGLKQTQLFNSSFVSSELWSVMDDDLRMKSYVSQCEREFHFLLLKENRVSMIAWWMVFFCRHCLWNQMISCGCEAALFLMLWSAAAISTVTHYIRCMIGLQCV